MGAFRKQEDRRQGLLLPPSPSDWLPENHLAWFVIDTVEELNIDALLASCRTEGKGGQAYPPRVMLALLIYAYCTGVFASRKIVRVVRAQDAQPIRQRQHPLPHRRLGRQHPVA